MKIRKETDKTPMQWAKMGCVAKEGHEPVLMYTNRHCNQKALFLSIEDVEQDPYAAVDLIAKEKMHETIKRRKRQLEKRNQEQQRQERYLNNARKWQDYLAHNNLILVFDTETSGLDPQDNDILSLSWQLIDASKNWEVLQERTCYFDWVSVKRTSPQAIAVNGLTRERLAELGTMERSEGIKEFGEAIKQADCLVAHNGKFDKGFVRVLACKEDAKDVLEGIKKPMYDTMKQMTSYCALPRYDGGQKWPKLSELAEILGIDDSDIDYHQSAADVELTKRCFIHIVQHGLDRTING